MHCISHGELSSWKGKLQLLGASHALVQHATKAQSKSDRSECTTCVCGKGKEGCSDGRQLPDWSSLGGLQPVISQLKEMVILPLLYPDLYQQMGISAPRSGFVPALDPLIVLLPSVIHGIAALLLHVCLKTGHACFD